MQYGIIIAVLIYELVTILGVAAILKAKQKKNAARIEGENFALAGRNMGVLVLAPTVALTVLGAAHILGVFEMTFGMGAIAIWFSLAHVIMVVMACFATGIWVRRVGVTTVPEMLRSMYGPGVAIAVTCTMAGQIWGVLTLECQGLGIVVTSLTGWPIMQAVVVGGILGILYVVFAGMEEVGWVNMINATVMYIGLIIAAIIVATQMPGGNFDFIQTDLLAQGGEPHMLSVFGNSGLFMTFAVGQIISVTFCQGISQMLMQTFMSAKNEKTIRRSVWLAAPINGLFGVFAVILGLAARSLPEFAEAGPKLAAMKMLVTLLPGWAAAILLAALLAAILSTFAMTSLTPATIWVNDIYKQYINPNASDKKLTNMTRVLIVVLAAFAILVSASLPEILGAIVWIFSWVVPVFFLVTFGLFWKRNSKVAGTALAVAWILNMLWSFTPLPQVFGTTSGDVPNSYVTLVSTLVIMVIGNLVCKGEPGYFRVKKHEAVE